MEPLQPPKTLKVYTVIKQSGANFAYTGGSSPVSIGVGFYLNREEAEHHRTLEVLKDTTVGPTKPKWHVFELEFPNPIAE
jgi:hypothetical protein